MRDNRGIKVTPDDDDDDDDLVRAWPRLVVSPYARGFPRPDTISFSRLGNPLPPLLARVATAQFLPRSPPIRSPLISKGKVLDSTRIFVSTITRKIRSIISNMHVDLKIVFLPL